METTMSTEPDAGDTANDGGAATDEHTRTVAVPLAEADVERIEFELTRQDGGEHAPESVEEWIEHAVHMMFTQIDMRVGETVRPEVDVPSAQALWARYRLDSAKQRGMLSADFGCSRWLCTELPLWPVSLSELL